MAAVHECVQAVADILGVAATDFVQVSGHVYIIEHEATEAEAAHLADLGYIVDLSECPFGFVRVGHTFDRVCTGVRTTYRTLDSSDTRPY